MYLIILKNCSWPNIRNFIPDNTYTAKFLDIWFSCIAHISTNIYVLIYNMHIYIYIYIYIYLYKYYIKIEYTYKIKL